MRYITERSFIIDAIRSAHRSKINYVLSYPKETHDLWELVYVLNGVVGVSENEEIYRLKKGQIIFHRPMEFHRIWSESSEGYEIIIMSFHTDTDALDRLGDGVFELSLALEEELIGVYSSVRRYVIGEREELEGIASDPLRAELAVRGLESFLLKVAIENSGSVMGGEDLAVTTENYRRIMSVLYENVHKNLSVAEIAKLSNMSVSWLNKTFKRYTGVGVMHHFNRIKIIKAMKMLDEGKSVAETSASLDFSSQAYFLTVFRRYTDILPSEYRKKKIHNIK